MSTLHGSWILDHTQGYLFIWGEAWRTMDSLESSDDDSVEIPFHPLRINKKELLSSLKSHNIALDKLLELDKSGQRITANSKIFKEKWQTQIITVPTQTGADEEELLPVLSGKMLSDTIDTSTLSLYLWQVEGFRLNPLEAGKFLQALPLGSLQQSDAFLGGELRFWSQIYRWSLDLLARGKFLPGLSHQEDGKVRSCWTPLLDSSVDQARLAKFSQLMPLGCRAYQLDPDNPKLEEPQELLLGFLTDILDVQLRNCIDDNILPDKELLVHSWLQSLGQDYASLEAEDTEVKRIETAINNWTLPVQDYLVNYADHKLKQNEFRTCLVLTPPLPGEINWGHFDWKLEYYLQAIDDAEFLIDAETIWQNPIEYLDIQGRTIERPQETLLKGLGLAARVYPTLESSLQESNPLQCKINPIQVYEFI
ncbi:MAG: hypothetical protein F6K10_41350, partial [Moorea sp. SIO2B7]|nr:hypothetical protein [Moorena sp. SIO2B7]